MLQLDCYPLNSLVPRDIEMARSVQLLPLSADSRQPSVTA